MSVEYITWGKINYLANIKRGWPNFKAKLNPIIYLKTQSIVSYPCMARIADEVHIAVAVATQ